MAWLGCWRARFRSSRSSGRCDGGTIAFFGLNPHILVLNSLALMSENLVKPKVACRLFLLEAAIIFAFSWKFKKRAFFSATEVWVLFQKRLYSSKACHLEIPLRGLYTFALIRATKTSRRKAIHHTKKF